MIRLRLKLEPANGLNEMERRMLNLLTVRERVLNLYQDIVLDLIEQGFQNETDPYREKWKPSKAAIKENRKTLTRTGRLRNSFYTQFSSISFSVQSNVDYAASHQEGRPERNLPRRAMLPYAELPDEWERPLFNVAEEVIVGRWNG